ncbi:MAG: folate-binding protein [Castellaniella sp.]|nr:folate-binding protein [Castellaniella sp.]
MSISAVEGHWPLADMALIHLQGPDAIGFLHGQLTNAVQGLPADRAHPAGYCTAQGRLLANGMIWSSGTDAVCFMVSRDLAEGVLRRLRLFVLRAKVTLSLDDSRVIHGVWGGASVPTALHTLPAWSRRDLDGATWIVAPHSTVDMPAAWCIGAGFDQPHDAAGAAAWRAARLASGWPWIRAASQDVFLPSALDMDINGGIDFKKGCYPGQEVIARSHYRGTVKRRMAYGMAPWPADRPAPVATTDLYAAGDATGRPVGRIIESAVHQGQLHVAAEITLTDWPAMRYAVESPDGAELTMNPPRGLESA